MDKFKKKKFKKRFFVLSSVATACRPTLDFNFFADISPLNQYFANFARFCRNFPEIPVE